MSGRSKLSAGTVWQIACEVNITASAAADLLLGVLLQLGISPHDIVEKNERGRSRIEIFHTQKITAQKVIAGIRAYGLRGVKVSLKKVQRSDWQDLWKKGIKPFALTKNIEVIPRWVKNVSQKTSNKFPIYIDTNLAFGTGLHETTQFMSQIIESCRGQFESFLDIGTGSGILAIVARHCGAKNITAFDIDPQSIAVAKENLAANKVRGVKVFAKDFAKWKSSKTYDLVAANLVTHDLKEFGEGLVRRVKPGKFLAVSGISLPNLPGLKKVFNKLPLAEVKTLRGKTWSAVLYKKI